MIGTLATTAISALAPSLITYLMSGGSNQGGNGGGSSQQFQSGGLRGYNINPKQSQLLQAPTQTAQGQQTLQALLSQGLQGMQNMPAPQFGPIKQAYEQNYRQNVMPSIAERFAGLGGEGAAGSSAFKASMLGAENQLQTQLAGMEQGFNQQNMGQLLQMLGLGLQPQFENIYAPRQQNWWESLLGPLVGGVGMAAGMTAPQWGPKVAGMFSSTPAAGK